MNNVGTCRSIAYKAGDPPCELLVDFVARDPDPVTQMVVVYENYPDGEQFTATLTANSTPQPTLTVTAASGPYRGTADLSATLSGCTDVANRAIDFTLTTATGQRTVRATTNDAGVATANATALTTADGAIPAGIYEPTNGHGISAAFAGETGCAAANGAASLTVTKRTPVITFATVQDTTYGATPIPLAVGSSASDDPAAPTLIITYSPPNVCGPAPAQTTLAILGAGQCTITVSQQADTNTNYADATPASQTITIAKATPTIAWTAPVAITYGTALSATELGAIATVNSTAVVGTYAYTANTAPVSTGTILAAGSYQLGVTFTPTDTANYFGATDGTTLTIDKAPLKVTTNPATKYYGAALPLFSATYKGFTNGDTPVTALSGTITYATAATDSSPVGPYVVTPDGLTAANYTLTFVAGTLDVQSAPLTITAEDKVRPYGIANPEFTVQYGAFVLNEDPGVLSGTLQCTSTATTTSVPSTYPIACSGLTAANYALAYQPGTLTIEKAAQAITFTPPARLTLGSPPLALDATADSNLTVSFTVTPNAPCAITGVQLTALTTGDCVVVASQSGDGNYLAATPVTRTIEIVDAPLPTPTPSPSPSPTPSPLPSTSPTPGPSQSPSPMSHHLNITTTGEGTAVATTPGPNYPTGTRVEINATPAAGTFFLGWTLDGTFQGWHTRLIVEMDRDREVTAAFATQATFPDTPGNAQQAEAIAQLTARGIIRGYGDGTFGPNDTVIRAQVAAMIVRAMGWQTAANTPAPFSDQGGIDDELWRAVGILASRGIVRGYGDNTYRPHDPILHVQAIGIIARSMVAAGYWTWQPDSPAVAPEILGADHRQEYATFIHYAGAVPGVTPDGHWGDWDQSATRGWFAQVLWQALSSYWSTPR